MSDDAPVYEDEQVVLRRVGLRYELRLRNAFLSLDVQDGEIHSSVLRNVHFEAVHLFDTDAVNVISHGLLQLKDCVSTGSVVVEDSRRP